MGFHVMCRLRDSRVIAPTSLERRLLARTVLGLATGNRLLAFNVADTHLHLQLAESRSRCGRLIRRMEIALTRRLRLAVGFGQPNFKPILGQGHLTRTFHYILRQEPHHGLSRDPYHEGSNLSDLLGLRTCGAYTAACVRQLLPRVRRDDLLGHLGVPPGWDLAEAPLELRLELLGEATLAAAGLLALGRDATSRRARRAAMAVAGPRVPRRQLARLLGVRRSTLRRMTPRPAEPQLVRAIRLQLGLRRAVCPGPGGAF